MKLCSQKSVRIIFSIGLLVLLTIVQLVGILHTHSENFIKIQTGLSHYILTNKDTVCSKPIGKCHLGKNEKVDLSMQCKICDLTYHQHVSFVLADAPGSLDLFPEVKQKAVPAKCFKLFQIAVQCWTNKGPPALRSI